MQRNLFFLIGALAVAGCASSQAARDPETAPPSAEQRGMRRGMMHQGTMGMCPMQVEGTTAMAEDVEGGAAIAFTTTGDVAEVRRRVAQMADTHHRHGAAEHGHGMGPHNRQGSADRGHRHDGSPTQGGEPHGGGTHDGMMGGSMMPAANARSEEIEGGSRIVLTPRDPTELTALREHARYMADRMASGQCPMMSIQDGEGGEASSDPTDHGGHHPSRRPSPRRRGLNLRGMEPK
jgi:hypothetical protein